jgi:hypothetical protein
MKMATGRAYWKGYLKLSLVTCPVALYPASSQADKTHFHQINRKTGNRLRQQMVDEETGKPVDKDQKGRGYEVSKGKYGEIEPEELEAVEVESTHTIDIDTFVLRTAATWHRLRCSSGLMKAVVSQLEKFGAVKRGRIGVSLQTVTPDIATALGLPRAAGAIIGAVEKSSPGALYGWLEPHARPCVTSRSSQYRRSLARRVSRNATPICRFHGDGGTPYRRFARCAPMPPRTLGQRTPDELRPSPARVWPVGSKKFTHGGKAEAPVGMLLEHTRGGQCPQQPVERTLVRSRRRRQVLAGAWAVLKKSAMRSEAATLIACDSQYP